jgi:hypothetical protein
MLLHAFVVGAAAAFGRNPGDDLVGVGDVAGLTVDAVGSVELEALAVAFGDDFIDRRGTEVLAGVAVLFDATGGADVGVGHQQVRGLVFLVAGAGVEDVGDFVEGKLAVGLEGGGPRSRSSRSFL